MSDLNANQKSGMYTLPFLSSTRLAIRIILLFFNLAFKFFTDPGLPKIWPQSFVAVVFPLSVLDGYPLLDVNDLVAGWSCVNILKLLLQLYWLGFGHHEGCYVFPLHCIASMTNVYYLIFT